MAVYRCGVRPRAPGSPREPGIEPTPKLDQRADGGLALLVHRVLSGRSRERVGRLHPAVSICPVQRECTLAEVCLLQCRLDLLGGCAELGLDVLLESRPDYAFDRVPGGPECGPARVGDRDEGSIEQVKKNRRRGAWSSRSAQRDTEWTWSTKQPNSISRRSELSFEPALRSNRARRSYASRRLRSVGR